MEEKSRIGAHKELRIAIVGAGAAGCFCAIEAKRRHPESLVTVYESGPKPLAKVALTGGGKCNLCNTFEEVSDLRSIYPRGTRLMQNALRAFSPEDTIKWWQNEGVRLVSLEGGRVFPESMDAMQIVRTLENLMRRLGVEVRCRVKVLEVKALEDKTFQLVTKEGNAVADKVVITTGGGALGLIAGLDIPIVRPVPSLFSFKITDEGLRALQGSSAEGVSLKLSGSKFKSSGSVLFTDWGLSGPAALKLSSYAARQLAENNWQGTLSVNWLSSDEDEARQMLTGLSASFQKKMLSSTAPEGISRRLWQHIISRAGLREDLRWAEMGSKGLNRLVATLVSDNYTIEGRSPFKDEFVTAGGVDLSAVNVSSLEAKSCPGLFFAGEVLDIDGITGGFNLQAAWSTGHIVATAI